MRVIVTGATGLLGTDICRALAKETELLGWARRVPLKNFVPVESVDITNFSEVVSSFRRWRPDWVIHTAALSDVDACEKDPALAAKVNTLGSEHVAKACQETGAALLAVSTDYVFDGEAKRPYREEDPVHPINAYGRSKCEAEEVVLRWAKQGTILRVSGLFGWARQNFVSSCAKTFLSGGDVTVVPQKYSPSFAVDLAQGIRGIMQKFPAGYRGILHLANSGGASREELACAIGEIVGIFEPESHLRHSSWEKLEKLASRPLDTRLDCTRYAQLIGQPLRSWQEALHAFFEK